MGKVYKARANMTRRNVPKYKVFYANGETYTNHTCPPEQLPKEGVKMILVEGNTGNKALIGMHYFAFDNLRWSSKSDKGIDAYLRTPGSKIVLYGVPQTLEESQGLIKDAEKDDYLPIQPVEQAG